MRALHVSALVVFVSTYTPARADDARVQRLAELGKLWGTVKLVHPQLAWKPVDWDAALVRAVPRVADARDDGEHVAAIADMLASIGDPATHVLASSADPPLLTGTTPTRREGNVLILDVNALRPDTPYGPIVEQLAAAKALVVDLRGVRSDHSTMTSFKNIDSAVAGLPLVAPPVRVIQRIGYAPDAFGADYAYRTDVVLRTDSMFTPPREVPERRAVFIVDELSPAPAVLAAMFAAGRARIVAEGTWRSAPTTQVFPLRGGRQAIIRTGERDGGEPLVIRADRRSPTLQQAVALARSAWRIKPSMQRSVQMPRFPKERPYTDLRDVTLPYRLLGLYRLWNAFDRFYAYPELLGDWDAALRRAIPEVEAAAGTRAYQLAIARIAARVPDEHVDADSDATRELFGLTAVPFRARFVEGRPVIVRVFGEAGGVRPGAIIHSIDGRPIAALMEEAAPYVTGATEDARRNSTLQTALGAGTPGTRKLAVVGADGKRSEINVVFPARGTLPPSPKKPSYKMLDNAIGYTDLTRLEDSEVDPMFTAFRDTRAIIFDMRGYPRGTFFLIAPRINTRAARVAAVFRGPMVVGDDQSTKWRYFEQTIDPTDAPLYRGKVVMLIDDRAVSQSEHTGLFLEAAAGATFIGTPTGGVNGDITSVVLPTGITVTFTGHDVRHADGRKLQGVGLQPHVIVAPTIAGVRAGRDEVLERAVTFVRTGR